MSIPIDLLKLCCLMSFLDSLPLGGARLGARIQIAYHASHEIDRAIEKGGLTDVHEIVNAVRGRIQPLALLEIEIDHRAQERTKEEQQ